MATAKKTSTAKKANSEDAGSPKTAASTPKSPRKKAAALPETAPSPTVDSSATPVAEAAATSIAAKVAKPSKSGKAQTTLSTTAPWPFPTYSKP